MKPREPVRRAPWGTRTVIADLYGNVFDVLQPAPASWATEVLPRCLMRHPTIPPEDTMAESAVRSSPSCNRRRPSPRSRSRSPELGLVDDAQPTAVSLPPDNLQLEREVGAPLIDRSTRVATLTVAGEAALVHAKAALAAARAATEAVGRLPPHSSWCRAGRVGGQVRRARQPGPVGRLMSPWSVSR